MIPIAMLYGTPEDAAAEIGPISEGVAIPSSFGWKWEKSRTTRRCCLRLWLSVPANSPPPFTRSSNPQTSANFSKASSEDSSVWPDSKGRVSWLGRFIDYLKEHTGLAGLIVHSCEAFTFPAVASHMVSDLYREPRLTRRHTNRSLARRRAPRQCPALNTESNLSWGLRRNDRHLLLLWLAGQRRLVPHLLETSTTLPTPPSGKPERSSQSATGWTPTETRSSPDEKPQHPRPPRAYLCRQMINLEWFVNRSGTHPYSRRPPTPSLVPARPDYGGIRPFRMALGPVMVINQDPSNGPPPPPTPSAWWPFQNGEER